MTAATLTRIGALLLLLLVPACHSGADACRPEGYPRKLGQRTQRFGAFVASRPQWFGEELDYRGEQHSQWWDRKTRRLGQEVDRTLSEGIPNFVADASSHAPSLSQTVSSWWGHLKNDTRCAADRVWYDMLILD